MTDIQILYQDQDLWVLHKPAGIVVNKAATVAGDTVQQWVVDKLADGSLDKNNWQTLVPADFDQAYGTPEDIFLQRQGIVHRLDKDTSGVLLVAKNAGALVSLLTQFRKRLVTKQYACLVHGKFSVLEDTITTPIARARADRQKFTTDPEGRAAETKYQVQQFFSQLDVQAVRDNLRPDAPKIVGGFAKRAKIYQGFSLVDCWPKTGRTHQIRVHMTSLKHPLVGDKKYVGKKRVTLDSIWCPRQFLHASQISFIHPRTQEKITIEASLPPDLQTALSYLSE